MDGSSRGKTASMTTNLNGSFFYCVSCTTARKKRVGVSREQDDSKLETCPLMIKDTSTVEEKQALTKDLVTGTPTCSETADLPSKMSAEGSHSQIRIGGILEGI